jgi:hypothetical protein
MTSIPPGALKPWTPNPVMSSLRRTSKRRLPSSVASGATSGAASSSSSLATMKPFSTAVVMCVPSRILSVDILDVKLPAWHFDVNTKKSVSEAWVDLRLRSDEYGEVFGYEGGLYVADGSVMPGPIGPNPSLTIAAVADRIAGRILA